MGRESLFPAGCCCQSYGHGLTMTRVDSPACPVHHPKILALVKGELVYIETPVDPRPA